MAVSLAVLSAGAQGKWERVAEPGDELMGISARVKYRIVDSLAGYVMAFYEPGAYWKVGIGGTIFMPDKRGTVHRKTLNSIGYATIGFYDEENRLVVKWEKCLMEITTGFQVAEASKTIWGKTSKGCRDVVPYLMNNRGYVRIVLPTASGRNFDWTVPCLNNE